LSEGLRELGYREGQNIVIEHRSSEGKYERLPDLAAELVRLKVDVIVAPSVLRRGVRSHPVPVALVAPQLRISVTPGCFTDSTRTPDR
jgi:hypothetical protein